MKKLIAIIIGLTTTLAIAAVDLKRCHIVTSETDVPLVQKMANVMSEDIQRVTGVRPGIVHKTGQGPTVILATVEHAAELTPEQLLAQAKAEIEELKTQALYKQAEFENYRKRTIKEKADLILNGSKSAVTALLPIIDDLERALPSMKKAEDVAAVAEGVELIYQKFLKALAGLGVKPIDTEGKDFDVDLHEAVAQVPGVPDEQKGRVIDCIEKGYMLNEQVIRHAKVAVGM